MGTTSQPKLVIWGASGHARVVAEIVRLCNQYELAGFLDDVHPEREGELFDGALILGGSEQLNQFQKAGISHLLLGFGDCAARLRLSRHIDSTGIQLATAIHPRAIVSPSARIGSGTVVAAGAVISVHANIGHNVIINTSSSVDHDCLIEDGVHVSPGVRLAGNVTVGRGTWIGIGATISPDLHIGVGSIVGAGSVVLEDIPDGVVAYGNPARVQHTLPAKNT